VVDAVLRKAQGLEGKAPHVSDLKAARDELRVYEARNIRREDFDLDKMKPTAGMTVARWADAYFDLEEVKTKRSIDRDRTLVIPVKRILGGKLLTDLCREDLFAYRNVRKAGGIIRGGKESTIKIADGTVKNELSLLRRMINLARDRGLQTSTVSFRGAIPEANTRARILTDTESERLFAILPTWFRRVVAGCASGRLVRGRSIALDRRHD